MRTTIYCSLRFWKFKVRVRVSSKCTDNEEFGGTEIIRRFEKPLMVGRR